MLLRRPSSASEKPVQLRKSGQFIQQCLCLFQVGRFKSFGEPLVDRAQKIVGVLWLTLVAPQLSQVYRSAKLERFGLLSPSKEKRLLE